MNRNIRNFCIIAHIDHGKSTLADRFLEVTKTIDKRSMKAQVLDQMELEQERGITIKLQPVRMDYDFENEKYILNLIDTPGHVDFSYEVSRSLAACEGAILLVDATQGIQAQTLANFHLAEDQGLKVVPVLNKIDLPSARTEEIEKQIRELTLDEDIEIIKVSAKTGENVEKVLQKIIQEVPAPKDEILDEPRGLIFDSVYDDYRGVVAFIRVRSGSFKKGDKIYFTGTGKETDILEVGYFKPNFVKADRLEEGEIGYIITGFKELAACKVGDTIINYKDKNKKDELELGGYKEMKPMVFAGFFCKEGVTYKDLREGLEKIKITDASLYFEPEHSPALGPGFRCGFLGLLHLEIIQERLRREFDLDLMVTVPSVAYEIRLLAKGSVEEIINSPQGLPKINLVEYIKEPWVKIDVITPSEYIGNIMEMIGEKRGIYLDTNYLSEDRIVLCYEVPLSSLLTDFYDKLKSISSGYASLNYEIVGYRKCEVERLDILVADELIDSLAMIVYKDESFNVGKKVVEILKDKLPKQMFEIKIQAVLNYTNEGKNKGGKIIASSRISAYRKDVTAKLYGGDVTRKNKLLNKQKKGKKKMMAQGRGRVDIPPEAYVAVLKR
jgi:GTP-binding protein LepA